VHPHEDVVGDVHLAAGEAQRLAVWDGEGDRLDRPSPVGRKPPAANSPARHAPRHEINDAAAGRHPRRFGPTCHTVFGRSYTHNVLQLAASGSAQGLLASVVGLCTKVWTPVGGATCAAIFGSYAGASSAAISQAAAQNQCAVYTSYFTDAVAIWRTDNGPLCKP
jgi:hypothetical protein